MTKCVWSRWWDISLVLFCVYGSQLCLVTQKKRTLSQFPDILTSHLVSNPYLYSKLLTYKGEDNCEEGSCRKCNCYIQIQHLKQIHWEKIWSQQISKCRMKLKSLVLQSAQQSRILLNGHFLPQHYTCTHLWRQRFDDDNTSIALKLKLSENMAK